MLVHKLFFIISCVLAYWHVLVHDYTLAVFNLAFALLFVWMDWKHVQRVTGNIRSGFGKLMNEIYNDPKYQVKSKNRMEGK